MKRNVVHFDLDTFFVSVARLQNSSLVGKPVIIGGSSDRGVVASCSYEARKFGVHSAMPMKLARRLCPSAVYLKGDMDSYSRYSKMVTDIMRDRVPIVEKASIDEFYLDLTGMDRFFGCKLFTSELKKTILKESGLPISYALASNKLVSKVATDDAKPNGQLEIPFGGEKGYLAPLKIERMPGVGQKTSTLLRRMGVETIQLLSEIPVPMMENLLGKNGTELSRKANGLDDTPVIPYTEQKSIGKEETFESDTIDMGFLYSELVRLTEGVAFQLRRQQRLCGCVSVKLRYANFDTATRQITLPYTANDQVLLSKTRELFQKLYDRRMLVRLLGVRVSHLVGGFQQISLFEDTEESVRLYQAMDRIRNKSVSRLSTVPSPTATPMYLNCKTYFSYRHGTIATEELVKMAKAANVNSLALTNINSTADCWDFVDFCRNEGIRPLVGCEIRKEDQFCYILLAKDDEGLMQINRFLTHHFQEEKEFPDRPQLERVWIIYAFPTVSPEDLGENELIGVRPHQVPRLYRTGSEQYPDKWVVLSPVTFQDKTHHNLHRLLKAIGKNTLVSKLETADIAREDERFWEGKVLEDAFQDYPFMVRRTLEVRDSCGMSVDLYTPKNKKYFTASREDDRILLENLAMEGLVLRYGNKQQDSQGAGGQGTEDHPSAGFQCVFPDCSGCGALCPKQGLLLCRQGKRGQQHHRLLPADHGCGSHQAGPLF